MEIFFKSIDLYSIFPTLYTGIYNFGQIGKHFCICFLMCQVRGLE